MSTATDQPQQSWIDRFKKRRRKSIKRYGKRFIRGIASFLGSQSTVGDTPVLDPGKFAFMRTLEANWETIRDELHPIMAHREAVPLFQEVSTDQSKISKGANWRTFILYGFGEKAEKNCTQAPETARILECVPGLQTAWFSILSPRFHIPPHRGVTKGILTCHLGLQMPKDAANCTMRVENEKVEWNEGKCIVFDDTYEHEVHNNTDDDRVVLLIQFDRPMRWRGRLLHQFFVRLLKLTAYYQEPKNRMSSFEDRFEAAVRRADANNDLLAK